MLTTSRQKVECLATENRFVCVRCGSTLPRYLALHCVHLSPPDSGDLRLVVRFGESMLRVIGMPTYAIDPGRVAVCISSFGLGNIGFERFSAVRVDATRERAFAFTWYVPRVSRAQY